MGVKVYRNTVFQNGSWSCEAMFLPAKGRLMLSVFFRPPQPEYMNAEMPATPRPRIHHPFYPSTQATSHSPSHGSPPPEKVEERDRKHHP